MAADLVLSETVETRKLLTKDEFESVPMSNYIPDRIRKAGVYPSFFKGYSLVFSAIATILKKKRVVPSKELIREELQKADHIDGKYIQNFFNKEGTIDQVLAAIIHRSWEEVLFRSYHLLLIISLTMLTMYNRVLKAITH